ncbi:uncharacterized protein [Argopecten irradians]|uniref:uncharacterized protein n=1 Tax=Argopecten irradians TaxID=31199 RepID=UPI00370F85F1
MFALLHRFACTTPIPTPRLSQACTPIPQTSKSSTSNRQDGSSCHLASEDSSYSDLVGRDMPKSEDSWVSVLFGDQDSDDGISNEEVQIVLDLDSDQNRKDALIPIRSQQLPSYTILTGLDKLSGMQLMDQKDMIEENLIEYADVEVDEENKENVMLERKCVSAIASLGNTGSRTSVLGTTHNHNSSNNNSSEDLKVQSRSIDSFRLNIEKQKTENPLKNSRVESWLSKEVQPSTAHGKRKESLFKRVMKLDMFRKRSKSVMPFIEKETNGKLTQRVPSLAELCRIILKSDLTAPGRTPLMEITATHLNQRYDPDQSSGAFEVSVDSLESAGGSVETAHEKRMNAIYQFCSDDDDDDESLLNLLMGREDDGNDCSRVDKHTEADSLQRSRDDTSDKIAKDSYLGSLNRTGQLSPFIRMIASRYHLFDPETQKWKEGYMDGPGHLDLYGSSAENIHPDEQTSVSPVAEEGVASITPPIEDDHHNKESSVLSSYNVLPPGSVREKVLHYEHIYVNELVDQVIEQTMHGLCLEQCIEELGSLGHHPELRRRLINEYIGTNISDCQRSVGEITPSDSEIYVDGSEGEILTPKISDGDISSESDDGHVESSKICQKSQIEDSLYSAVTDVADTDYATAVSDMDTDGSYVVSFLSNADLDSDISGLDTKEQPTLNASGEYVDLPEQLSYYNGRYSCHSKPMMCENPVLSEQKNMDGPWVSPVNTRLRIGLGACPRKDTGFHDSPDCRLYTPRCSIGTQTPEMVNRATSDDDTPRNKSFGGKTEDRASSPIKELLSYDTTLEDSLDTSVVVTPAKVRPRYSSSPIKTYEEEEDRQSKRKLDETSDHQAEVISLSQNDKSKKSKTSSQDVNTGKTFDVSDCTEKRRKRFSWKKMFHSKPKEPAVLVSFRRRSDKEMEEDLIKDSVIPQVTKDDVAMESNATIPADCSNNAVCENQPDQVNPIIIYKTRPFSEDLNTVETFFSHEQSINLSLYRIHEDSRHGSKSSQEPVTDNLIHDSINDEEESDIEKYSL